MTIQSEEKVKEVVVSKGLTSHERNLTINKWVRDGYPYVRSVDSDEEGKEILIFRMAKNA